MKNQTHSFIIAGIGILVNILMILIFWARAKGFPKIEYNTGLFLVSLAIPLAVTIGISHLRNREWWQVVLPSLMILFMIIEFVLDYVLQTNFRQTALVWPYIGIYLMALMGMIGYAFMASRILGWIMLAVYFCNLTATLLLRNP
ncbi:MAG: hypothetical protein GXO90_06165 [FCB group bacterium]|nr:hypothetical protein [FCB group bacterium]